MFILVNELLFPYFPKLANKFKHSAVDSKRTIEKGAMIEMRADWLLPNNAKQEVTVRTLKVEKYFAVSVDHF